MRNSDIAISSEKRQKQPKPELHLISFVACKTVGEYNRNKRKIEKFCLAEKTQAAKAARMEQPKRSEHQAAKAARLEQPTTSKLQMPTTSLDAPGPSSAAVTTTSHQQGTTTPIDDNEATPLAANSSLDISPITTKTRPATTPKKFTKKNSPRTVQKGKRSSIRKKATVSAAKAQLTSAKAQLFNPKPS